MGTQRHPSKNSDWTRDGPRTDSCLFLPMGGRERQTQASTLIMQSKLGSPCGVWAAGGPMGTVEPKGLQRKCMAEPPFPVADSDGPVLQGALMFLAFQV